ncbi:MAG: site-2 protease family protein [Gammaproteobacteria bacterium]|nr:site-2 protease family protein [Gammaproteobacteria bacterium]NNL99612.1 site-2 protease family protein [Gammaproteobacteria bacterium]
MNQVVVFVAIAVPVIFAVTLHEVAHGWVARSLGDDTAARANRLSLNPLRHVDPVGTVAVPLILYLTTDFLFGWARPVPIDWRKLRHARRDIALVAVAGPAANLAMLVAWGLALKLGFALDNGILISMSRAGIIVNIVLMVLNLVPIPPLDGSRVLSAALPPGLARQYLRLEPFGLIIVVVLLASGVLGRIVGPVLVGVQDALFRLLGL